LIITSLILLVNDQIIIAEKDLFRKRGNNCNKALVYKTLTKMSVKDIFPWIRFAYLEISKNPEVLLRHFKNVVMLKSLYK